jgi:ubiquinone/menaquinone biosynthesis C-methylase UbiE
MIIFQPDRHLLKKFVCENAKKFTGSVLDIGGGGKRYEHLFRHCDSYKMLDINSDTQPDIVGSVEAIPLPDNSIDGIICTQVLGDVWGTQKAIAEMIRILKPQGLLLITESLFNEEHDEPRDYWRFTKYSWKKLLEDTCKIDVLETRGGFFGQRAQQTIRYRIERHNLYQRPILGRAAHLWALVIGKYALLRDRLDRSKVNKKFPIGYCILAHKL